MGAGQRARFGEQRLVRPEVGAPERLLFSLLGIVDPAHFLHSAYFISMLNGLPDFAPRQILDAGCGRGDYSFYLARRFPQAEVVGIDFDEARITRNLETARMLGLENTTFIRGDLTAIDYSSRFDLVLSIDVLEHITEQDEVLRRLARALVPGGWAFYHLPTVRPKPVPFSRYLRDFHEWAEDEHVAEEKDAAGFTAAVAASGLEIVRTQRTFGYFTGELANSLFVLPYRDTTANKVLQALLAPLCRVLSLLDSVGLEETRYAAAVTARKPQQNEQAQRLVRSDF